MIFLVVVVMFVCLVFVFLCFFFFFQAEDGIRDADVTGVQTCALPISGRKPNGENYYPKLELVRFTLPRRVYTQAHMDVIAESVAAVYQRRSKIKGLKMTYEPKYLRFFQAKFEQIK